MKTSPYEGLSHLMPEVVATSTSDRLELVQRALERWAADPPGAVWIDDVPNLDPESLVVLYHVVEQRLAPVVMTARDGEATPGAVQEMVEGGAVEVIVLAPLSERDTDEILTRALAGPVDATTVRRLFTRSGGNPLLLREVVRSSVSDGSLREQDGAWRWVSDGGRGGIADLALRHTAELGPEARRVLDCLAITGTLPSDAAVAIQGELALAELGRSGVVTIEDGDVAPAHPLFVETTLAVMSPTERAWTLRRLVEVLGPAAVTPIERLRIIRWRRELGDALSPGQLAQATSMALGVFDTATAIDVGRAAVDAGRDDAAITVALALTFAGELDAAAPFLDRAVEAAEDEGSLAFATLSRTLNQAYRGGFTPAIADQHRLLLPTMTQPGMVTLIRSELASALAFSGQLSAAVELAGPYVLEGEAEAWDALAYVPGFGAASSTLGRTGLVLDRLAELAPAAAPFVGRHVAWFHAFTAQAALLHGDLERAEAAIADFERLAHLAMVPGVAAVLHAETLGIIAMWRGDLATAVRRLTEAVARSDVPESNFRRVIPLAHLATALALTGDGPGARRHADEALEYATWFPLGYGYAQAADAWAVAASGDLTGASRAAVEGAHRCLERELVSPAMWCLSDALRLTPTPRIARELAEVTRSVDGAWSGANAVLAAAVIERDGAVADDAAERFAAIGAVLHAADAASVASALWHGAGRASSGRASGARARAWRSSATDLGFASGAERAAGTSIGSSPMPASLTPREREVVDLAAAGGANAEIAEALGLSVRTVEGHLHRAMAKLGVSRRDDLPPASGAAGAIRTG